MKDQWAIQFKDGQLYLFDDLTVRLFQTRKSARNTMERNGIHTTKAKPVRVEITVVEKGK